MDMTETNSTSSLTSKKAAGLAAAELVQDGMLVGLGTGSTTAFFIEALGKRCQAGLTIQAAATSERSELLAKQFGIPFLKNAAITLLDLTVDGADEIDAHKNMIKGGGGALLKEKILAGSSREMIVIVDETKVVKQLGKFPLPIEVSSFAYSSTLLRLQSMGYQASFRLKSDKTHYVTESGNLIIDIQFTTPITDPYGENERLKSVIGVLETGLFFNLAGRVIVGYHDGHTQINP